MKNAKKLGICLMALIILTAVIPLINVSAANRETVYSTSFETDADFLAWHFIDADGDTKYWDIVDYSDSSYEPKDGTKMMRSKSYDGGPLTPDNLAVGPVINLPSVGSGEDFTDLRMTWYDCADSQYMPNEEYSVYIYECKESDPTDEELKNNSTLLETIRIEEGGSRSYNFREICLNDYQNRSVRIIFRHNTETAQRCLKIDMITVEKYCSNSESLFSTSFEADENLSGWLYYDEDQDGFGWKTNSQKANEGTVCLASRSYIGGDLNSNNFLISPKISIDKKYGNLQATWYAGGMDLNRFNETYSVYVYTGTETAPDKIAAACVNSTDSTGADYILGAYRFREYTLDLDEALKSLGNPQNIRLVFRHHDCKGSFYGLLLDDVSVTGVDKRQIISSGTVEVTAPNFDRMASENGQNPDVVNVTLSTESGVNVNNLLNSIYSVDYNWYKTEDSYKSSIGSFDFGESYSVDVTVTINDNSKYLFANNFSAENAQDLIVSDTEVSFTLEFQAVNRVEVNELSVGEIAYELGENITDPEISISNCNVSDGVWMASIGNDNYSNIEEEKFLPNKAYKYTCNIRANKGYYLAESFQLSENISFENGVLTVYYEPLSAKAVNEIAVSGITAPVIGNVPDVKDITVTPDPKDSLSVTENGVKWVETDDASEKAIDCFKANTAYTLKIQLNVNELYAIGEKTEVSLQNGLNASKFDLTDNILSIDFNPLEKTEITSVAIEGITAPEIGNVPDTDITVTLDPKDSLSVTENGVKWVETDDASEKAIDSFKANTAYTLKIQLNVNELYAIGEETIVSLQDGLNASIIKNENNVVTISVSFDKLEQKEVSGLSISAPEEISAVSSVSDITAEMQNNSDGVVLNPYWATVAKNDQDDYVFAKIDSESFTEFEVGTTYAAVVEGKISDKNYKFGDIMLEPESQFSVTFSDDGQSFMAVKIYPEIKPITIERISIDVVAPKEGDSPNITPTNLKIYPEDAVGGVEISGEWQVRVGDAEYVAMSDGESFVSSKMVESSDPDTGDRTETEVKCYYRYVLTINPSSKKYSVDKAVVCILGEESEKSAITDNSGNKTGAYTIIKEFGTANYYKITFNTNGGSTPDGRTGEIDVFAQPDNTINVPKDLTMIGYTFAGWSPEVPATMPAENVTVTAQWTINQYTITFADTGDTVIDPITQDYGTDVYAPDDPEKTGYTFDGWDTEIPATMPAGDMIITAKWKINQYTITFADTGDSVIAPITQDYGTAVTAPQNPTKTGYTFDGWDVSVPATMPAGDMTITAQWKINQYTITFADTGDSVIAPITQDYATAITDPEDPTRVGYTFAGWDTEVPATMPAENVTVTAQWTINQYTITFDTDGGSEVAPITQDYGTDVTAPQNPTNEGYTFAGWSPEVPATMPAENVTVKAQWNVNSYTVTWDVDGVTTEESYEYGATINAPADPEKTGYTFAGWTPSVAATMPAENVTYTATWTANTYNATFNAGEGTFADGSSTMTVPTAYDTAIAAPADPTRPGYTFGGWTPAVGNMDDVNGKTFTATWIADTDTKYTVETYTMNTAGTYEMTSQVFAGATDSEVTASYTVNEGFALNTEKSVLSGTVLADNSLVLKVYLDRKSFTFTTDVDGVTTDTTYLYGAKVTPVEPSKDGYTFAGWSPEVPATMPAGDMTITAQWAINKYKVTWNVDRVQTVNEFDFGSTIIVPKSPQKDHYVFNGWTPEIPDKMPAKDLVFTAVFEPIEYTVSFIADGKTVAVQKYTINAQVIDVPAVPKKTGYSGIWEQYSLNGGNKVVNAIYTLIAKPEIRNFRSERTEKYKTTITFAAKYDNMLPDNSSIHWFINGRDVGTGAEYTVKNATGDFTVQVKLIAQNGEILHESQIESVKIKTGFFDKLVAFFQGLFGSLPRVTQ